MRADSDAGFANHVDTRQSTMSPVIFVGRCIVGWYIRHIKTVITITGEAENIATSNATAEIHCIHALMRDIRKPQKAPTQLDVDNPSAISIANTTR